MYSMKNYKWNPPYFQEPGLLKLPTKPPEPFRTIKTLQSIQPISQTQMQEMRNKGLCYYYETK